MKLWHRREVRQKSRGRKRAFLTGFISIIVLAGVFYTGYQFGRGTWYINFNRQVVSENKSLPDKLDYSSVDQVYQQLKQRYDGQLKVSDLITGLKKGLVTAANDPYTIYMDTSEAKSFNEQLNGSFSGIGAELGKKGTDIVVISPISGFPAEKAGLKAGDIIIKIDDQDATNLSVDEAVTRIRGDKGTTVKLAIIRGGSQSLELSIVRDIITIPSVNSKTLDGNIGYVQITRFAEDTVSAFNSAIQSFINTNVRGVILDLRNDPGGYLNDAVSVAQVWLKNGQIILEEKRGSQILQTYRAESDGAMVGKPTIVLINEGSASASEIVAGALKDNGAAKIVGVTSFGKGSVQEFSTFSAGDVLKVTIARWYTPSGRNIDKQGIEPDIKQVLSDNDIANKVDSQLNAAITLLKL
jgi:carboxyl-terminal processing protease